MRQNGNNLLTQSLTLDNVPSEPLPDAVSSIPELITIAEGRSKPEGNLITVQGTVTTEPGIYGGQTAGKANGVYTYTYVGELANAWGVSQSQPLLVTVTDALPGKPVLSHDHWTVMAAV